jgi:prepilin-type N-terminal cleavage/methylation domain-containing protein
VIMNVKIKTRNLTRGFTLVEILAALTIGSMVLIVVLAIYSRAQSSAASVTGKLENNRLPREIMQRIAEDLDRVTGFAQDTQITVENKFQDGYAVAKMEISRTINDVKNQPQLFEKIVWQSSIEPDTGVLALYRSHSGLAMEDSLLDRQKEPWQRELFVPVCTGLSFFRIEIPQDANTMLNQWSAEGLPRAIVVTLSFAQPYKTADGTFDVPDEDKVVRTIAIDRGRKPQFTLPPIDPNLRDANEPNKANEPNQPDKAKEPKDINDSNF